MIQINLTEIVGALVAAIVGGAIMLFVKRWYQQECDRRDAEKKIIQRYMIKTDAIVYAAITVLNGKGEEFERVMESKYESLCKEKNL